MSSRRSIVADVFKKLRWKWPEFLAKVGHYVPETPDDNGEYADEEE